MRIRAILLALSFAVLASPAFAQQTAPNPPLTGDAWYEAQLVDLANVLGGAHYLRIRCQGNNDQRWRDYMLGVINREPRFHDELVENFNRGYRDQEARYPQCDTTAQQAEAELRARGLRISSGLSARHSTTPHQTGH